MTDVVLGATPTLDFIVTDATGAARTLSLSTVLTEYTP